MPSKTTKKARRAGTAKSNAPVEKDDGSRWIVVDQNDHPIYLTKGGVMKAQAERLAMGLVTPGRLKQVV